MRIVLTLLSAAAFILLMACDTAEKKPEYSAARVIQTSRSGDHLALKGKFNLEQSGQAPAGAVRLDPQTTFQTIEGFGGAFTESSAHVLNQLSPGKKQQVLQSYFGTDGAAYSLMRTHMNSCDFSLDFYSYADVPDDTLLEHFSIRDDLDDLVPLIKEAQAASREGFKLLASPWTAPPWMKDNNGWNGGSLKAEFYPAWALYFSRYIRAYEREGISVWGVTVENEPLGNGGQWESMIFSPRQMADFVKNYLGPQFERDGIKTHILIYDQNRDHLAEWAGQILGDPQTAQYVWGTAVHWYSSTVEWYPQVLDSVHRQFPEKALLHTEGCIDSEVPLWQDDAWYWSREATDWGFQWAPEEDKHLHPKYVPVYRYARDIIGGLNSWLTGWIDWNIVLDDKGGPNHASNWCIAPVIVKPETDEVYYTPLFAVMSHFSRFIRPGAARIAVDGLPDSLMITACINPDQTIAVVVLNQGEQPVRYHLAIGDQSVKLNIPASALQTIVLD